MPLRLKTLLITGPILIGMMAILVVTMDVWSLHWRAAGYSLALLLTACGLVTTSLLLDRRVVAPLVRLCRSVATIAASGDLSARVPVTGGGEPAMLGAAVNGMLAMLEEAQRTQQQARAELMATEKVQAVTYRIAAAANRSGSLEGLLGHIHRELGTIIDTRNFYIAVYDPEQDVLRFPYYVDETFPQVGSRTPEPRRAGRGLTEYVMRTGQALLASGAQVAALAARGEIELIGAMPEVWLGAPLHSDGRTVGAIAVQSYTDAKAYGEEDLRLLEFVSGQIGGAIERKRSEEAVARSRDFYLTLFDEFPALIWRSDMRARCDYCNRSFLEFTGRTPDEQRGDGWQEVVHPEDRERWYQVAREAMDARRPFELEHRLRRHDGQYRWFLNVGRPYHDVDGNPAGYLGSCYDVTERKRLEDQLRQSQKMEAIGRLAGGVAHDFNNLLTAITGYATFARDALAPDSPTRDDITQVLKAAERAARLTQQLLAFSRRGVIAPSVVNLNEVIINLGKMLLRLISEDIEVVTVPASDLGAVKVDAGQVEQVLVNLVVNAGDAMPGGGRLTIETANVTLDAEYARQHVGVAPGEYVMLAVSDTGCGMTDEVKARIFEPFFTTKEAGRGTGLGLATCYGIVKQNHGHIWFYSEEGKGTTFKVYFPRAEPGTLPVGVEDEAASHPLATQTVLLVEDDASVRSFAARALRDGGYTVLEAANGAEALGLAAQRTGQPIHLLVTDIVMPVMGGEELARRLRANHPELNTLFVSGYTANAVVHRGVLQQGAAFLQKPFTLNTLTLKVREVLGS